MFLAYVSLFSGTGDSVQCELCEMGAKYLKTMLDSNITQQELEDLLDRLCDIFPDTVTAQVRLLCCII